MIRRQMRIIRFYVIENFRRALLPAHEIRSLRLSVIEGNGAAGAARKQSPRLFHDYLLNVS